MTIAGNIVGLNASATAAVPNTGTAGIYLSGATSATIGGPPRPAATSCPATAKRASRSRMRCRSRCRTTTSAPTAPGWSGSVTASTGCTHVDRRPAHRLEPRLGQQPGFRWRPVAHRLRQRRRGDQREHDRPGCQREQRRGRRRAGNQSQQHGGHHDRQQHDQQQHVLRRRTRAVPIGLVLTNNKIGTDAGGTLDRGNASASTSARRPRRRSASRCRKPDLRQRQLWDRSRRPRTTARSRAT